MKTSSCNNISFTPAFLLLVLCAASSCRKDMPELNTPEKYVAGNLSEEFDAFWNGMNNNYMFWDVDPTDWNEVYRKYDPLFSDLDMRDSSDVRKAYTYFEEMTGDLVDGHFYLTFYNKYLRDENGRPLGIYPLRERHKRDDEYHEVNSLFRTLYSSVIPDNYLSSYQGGDYVINENGSIKPSPNTVRNDFLTGMIKGTNILYFRCHQFRIMHVLSDIPDSHAAVAVKYFLEHLSDPAVEGIIIDMRGNVGGQIRDLNGFISSLVDKPTHFGYTRQKIGNNRLDYGPWVPVSLQPNEHSTAISVPIVVLADVNSISMGEVTVMAIQSLPNGKFVGERTWGGIGGAIANNRDIANAGQFRTSFFSVFTPYIELRDKSKISAEGIGITPDVAVGYDEDAVADGRDPQLEEAMRVIQ